MQFRQPWMRAAWQVLPKRLFFFGGRRAGRTQCWPTMAGKESHLRNFATCCKWRSGRNAGLRESMCATDLCEQLHHNPNHEAAYRLDVG